MQLIKRIQNVVNQWLDVPTTDPDDARRRKLLNALLFAFIAGAFLIIIVSSVVLASNIGKGDTGILFLLYSGIALFLSSLVIYWINRHSGYGAAWLLLTFFTIGVGFSDTPQQVVDGRSVFFFAIPIAIASLLLKPATSFAFAGLSTAINIFLALSISVVPNVPAIAGFFMLALVSWLSSRSLENALREVRNINANLDQLVTERTQALAESLARERVEAGRNLAILDSIADGVVVFDLHGQAIQANPSLTQLLSLPTEEIISKTINDLSNAEAMDSTNRGILAGLLADPGRQLTSQRVDWDKKTLSVSAAQVHDSEGTLIGTVAVFRDYTREAEVERMKNTFLGIVSHELRTPLNAILGYAEMFKEGVYGVVNPSQIKASIRIMANSQRLLGIVNDLLDHTRIEAGKVTIQMRSFHIKELVENVESLLEKPAAEKGLALSTEVDPSLPDAMVGDPARLQQVMVNLVNNSIKYTDHGSIHARAYKQDNSHWVISVSDTGRGIPKEKIPLMFEAFRQGQSDATREQGGFGLGLAIVKQLIDLMGGEISVESQVGVGSTFTVNLPLVIPS